MKTKLLLLLTALMVALSASAQTSVYHFYPDGDGNYKFPKCGTITWDGTQYIHTLDNAAADCASNNSPDAASSITVAEKARGIKGDVNHDGEVNVADVHKVVASILSDDPAMDCDVNGDYAVNISDVNAIIYIILNPEDDHEWVDLGLPSGTLWATCNVGANAPEQYGDYFALGETEPKDVYDWSTYKWCDGSQYSLTKYCSSNGYGIIDYKNALDPEDDAAYMNWGSSWRTPTKDQLVELMNVCTWTSKTQNGVSGLLVTGPNGNTMFMPYAGHIEGRTFIDVGSRAGYWSQTDIFADMGHIMYFNWSNVYIAWEYRCEGWSVRPVRCPKLRIEEQNYDFGEVPVGETHTGELTIVNNTAEEQTLTVTADEPFLLKQQDGSAASITVSVPGGSSATVTVVFTATTPGEFNGNVTFKCPALDGGQRVIPVQALAYSGEAPEHRYVDLGLPSGTLWATCNVGASRPEDCGDHFAWGETEPKENYSLETYKWYDSNYHKLTKYCTSGDFGTVDNLTELYPNDDAAFVNWGSSWRMPTEDQFLELSQYCSKKWTTRNGVNGYLYIGPSGNTIFMPTTGRRTYTSLQDSDSKGCYWSRTLVEGNSYTAWILMLYSTDMNCSSNQRSTGCAVRAVRASQDEIVKELYISHQGYDFGDVPVGETRTGELTIFNYSNQDQTVVVTVDEPFLLRQEDGNATSATVVVPSNSNVSVTVMFTATEDGQFNGNVTFQNPLFDGGQTAIPLQALAYTDEVTQFVDLGLPSGTLWATRNVGANRAEEYGSLFAWGETAPKEYYNWSNYKWCNGSSNTLTKYCTDSHYGTVDGKTELEPEDDAASANWGSAWRMPTQKQQDELERFCTWTWISRNGVDGYKVTGPNGNSLFLPTAYSIGDYWSRTCTGHNYATGQSFDIGGVYMLSGNRCSGFAVRPVLVSFFFIEQQSLDLGDVIVGDTRTGKLTIVNYTQEEKTVFVTADEPFLLKLEDATTANLAIDVPGNSSSTVEVVFTATEGGEYNGNVTFRSTALEGGKCVIPVTVRATSGHEWVDLGLPSGTLWATCNIGASTPEEYGDYFAWGETEPKDDYWWNTYKWCNGSENTLTKYCSNSRYGYNGFTDDKMELDPEDDAAYVNWGSSWRMPTIAQQEELAEQCTWTWTTRNGVKGCLVTGPNGDSIFLPAASYHSHKDILGVGSYGHYWLRSFDSLDSDFADILHFNWNGVYLDGSVGLYRCDGAPVRAVRASQE